VPDGEIFEQTAVDVSGEIDDPAKASRMAFVVRTASDAVAEGKSISVPTTPGQFVRKMDGGGFQVFVDQEADEPPEGFSGTKLQPIAADEEPNAIIDSRHASIRRIATASIRGQLGDREVAMTLARTTKDLLSLTSQSKEMTRSSAIVQETVGGSTEYAIVLASLLRAKNIASRLALGIKYDPNEDVMRYHVWTIAFVDGRWISLDATEGGLAASDRITFVTTNLKDANPFNAVAATMAMMGRADIEIKP
jgi:transglutaminase-like putative cysteine protease